MKKLSMMMPEHMNSLQNDTMFSPKEYITHHKFHSTSNQKFTQNQNIDMENFATQPNKPSSSFENLDDPYKRFEIPKHFQDSLSECSRKIQESQKQWNLEFQNVELVNDNSPNENSFDLERRLNVGEGLIDSHPSDIKFISLPNDQHFDHKFAIR